MSMSEFERDLLGSKPDPSGLSMHDKEYPADFSLDDADFARELDTLFSIKQETIPPLFVQTLLDSEGTRLQIAEEGFEKKTCARVFRQLSLQRRLFRPAPPLSMATLGNFLSASRSFMTAAIVCMVFMLTTMVVTVPAFASGLNYLWAGAHSGVVKVHTYPAVPAPAHVAHDAGAAQPAQINLLQAQDHLHFPVFLPQYVPARYTQNDIYIYQGDQSWADGPIMVLDYTVSLPGVAPRQIAICEFKPQGNVFQVVQDGAAQQIRVGQDGSTSAIYVQGQWTQENAAPPYWVYTDRSELIYEDKSGVVFWIVGDKRDGIDDTELRKIALSLHPFKRTHNVHITGHISNITQSAGGVPWWFADDVVYLDNQDNPNGPSFKLVGSNPDAQTAHPSTFYKAFD